MWYSSLVVVFKHTLFFKPIFENPYLLRAVGWATIPCMYFIENYFKLEHEWEDRLNEIYIWSYCYFNWYHWILSIGINNWHFLYTHIFVCMYAFISKNINSIGIYFSYIYMFYLCLLYPYIFKHKILFMMISLSFNFSILFQLI